jgi:shikimate kinase
MPNLIILRGPMGSGKSTIGKYLREKLDDSYRLDLDRNADNEIEFLDEALLRDNVVGEMYDGGSHTTDPSWINKFKEKGYNILSVILNANLETCLNRVLVIRGDKLSNNDVEAHFNKFHKILGPIFKINAYVFEISIDTDKKDVNTIGNEILNHL